ncbi:MAG: citrate/2-methylcitrate synthase [Phycisphaerales bacterium JB040]
MTTQTETRIYTGESLVRDGAIEARGVPIGSLIDTLSFVDMLFFQLQAREPTPAERAMTDAYLVSLCEHGVTSPSTHGPRVAASVRAPFAATAVSFIAGAMGPYHFGALEASMHDLLELDRTGETPDAFVARHASRGERIWGYGHRFHKSSSEPEPHRPLQEDADPRVRALLDLADRLSWEGRHLANVRAIGRILCERKGVPINIDGVAAGLLLDMGFRPEVALLFVIIGRLPNIARLHLEEQDMPPNRFTALATREDPGFDRTIDRDLDEGITP